MSDMIDVDIAKGRICRVAYKLLDRGNYVDIRAWNYNTVKGEYYPSKKGLMVKVDRWDSVIEAIQSVIQSNKGTVEHSLLK